MNVSMGIFVIPFGLAILAVRKIKEEDLTKFDEFCVTAESLPKNNDLDTVEEGKRVQDIVSEFDVEKEPTPQLLW